MANEKMPYLEVLKKMLDEVDLDEVISQCEQGNPPKGVELILIGQIVLSMDGLIENVKGLADVIKTLVDKVNALETKTR